ncbi:MAG: peroxiredoxin [Dokdonella sp.]
MLEKGKRVPKLDATLQDGSLLKAADLSGSWLVLYFYPKDATSGCTREAQDFRDLHDKFVAAGARIVGVSRDSAASHARFIEKQLLPFDLIADVDETWCKAYDVLCEKQLYGRRYIGVVRSTFLIDPEGVLVESWRKVTVPGHAEAVLARLAES